MYYFVQKNPNKKEKWQMLDAKQVRTTQVAFQTVLQVSNDPESFREQGVDPDDKVRYQGPMYFDLDGSDIEAVLDSARDLIQKLKAKNIPTDIMSIYLSGKKGLHITIPEKIFGITAPLLHLPVIWGKFSESFGSEHIDDSVYSMGKGRMWRTTGVKRPDNNKYKVQITAEELSRLTVEGYNELVSSPRPDFAMPSESDIEAEPALVAFIDAMKTVVRQELKAKKKAAENISVEDLRAVPGVPGCIEKLITEGDCPESNWNQAAMQLAGYIAGRYTRDDEEEYLSELVKPFLDNVTSSSRSDSERRRAMEDSLGRAFGGSLKFSAGGVIAAIGKKCGDCVICAKKKVMTNTDNGEWYDEQGKLRFTANNIQVVGENSSRPITNFGLQQEKKFMVYDDFNQLRVESGYYHLEVDGSKTFKVEIPEAAFHDRRAFAQCIIGSGGIFTGSEIDLLHVNAALGRRRTGLEEMIRSSMSGIKFHKEGGEIYPHLITAEESYARGGVPSKFVYTGRKELAVDYRSREDFSSQEQAESLIEALRSIFLMNESHLMATSIGWVVAAHLKTHLTFHDKQYPMLNLCGSSHTGKSTTAFILLTLNGFPYQQAPFWNAEVDTIYPLEEMVSTSTTTIRMIDEANEINAKRNWSKLIGLLKASWDAGGIMKGGISGRNITTRVMENPAPLMYLSEQSFPIQAIRTRSLECHFSTKTLEDKIFTENHHKAIAGVHYLEMFAKVLATAALNTPLKTVDDWRQEAYAQLPKEYVGRTQIAYGVVLVGLKFLESTIRNFDADFADEVAMHATKLVENMNTGKEEMMKAKRHSALDDILMSMDMMAMESENPHHGLEVGVHYWKKSGILYLDIRSIFPRYQRFSRGIGRESSISTAAQLFGLLRGETYFRGMVSHPNKAAVEMVMIDLATLSKKGSSLVNFEEGDAK